LASKGIIVIRYDKELMFMVIELSWKSPSSLFGKKQSRTPLEAVKYLRTQPEVDTNQIYVLGHSLGGTAIPRIGQNDPYIKV